MNDDQVRHESNLVWSRYNAIVVAATIGIALLGQVATATGDLNRLGALASILGILASAVWWLLTSYGWSLVHSWGPVSPVYLKWRTRVWRQWPQDPLWTFAHALIALFYFAYVGFLLFFLHESAALSLVASVIVAAVFLVLLGLSYTTLSLQRAEKEAAGAQLGVPADGQQAPAAER